MMHRIPRSSLVVALVFLCASVTACRQSEGGPCEEDANCEEGLVCFEQTCSTTEARDAILFERGRPERLEGSLSVLFPDGGDPQLPLLVESLESNKRAFRNIPDGQTHFEALIEVVELQQLAAEQRKAGDHDVLTTSLDQCWDMSLVLLETGAMGQADTMSANSAAIDRGDFSALGRGNRAYGVYENLTNISAGLVSPCRQGLEALAVNGEPKVRMSAFESMATPYPELAKTWDMDDMRPEGAVLEVWAMHGRGLAKATEEGLLASWETETDSGNRSAMDAKLRELGIDH